jgi:predicted ATPase
VLTDYFHRASELPLRPLSAAAAEQLLTALLPGGMLDEETRREIVERAEGNPLYVQELLRAVVESAGVDRSRTWTLPTTGPALLPANLESLFISRIDRLPRSARRLAQAAAVAGRTFPVRVVAAVLEREDVADDLAVLLRAEIVREVHRYPELECSFQHGLLQQAALSTLTPARRRALYGRAARAYERLYENTLEDRLEILALYYYRSDEQARALEYLERAGARAERIDARVQAAQLWRRALKVALNMGNQDVEGRIRSLIDRLGPVAADDVEDPPDAEAAHDDGGGTSGVEPTAADDEGDESHPDEAGTGL